jgi:hypothetical protein
MVAICTSERRWGIGGGDRDDRRMAYALDGIFPGVRDYCSVLENRSDLFSTSVFGWAGLNLWAGLYRKSLGFFYIRVYVILGNPIYVFFQTIFKYLRFVSETTTVRSAYNPM